jgi:hypothetical protein
MLLPLEAVPVVTMERPPLASTAAIFKPQQSAMPAISLKAIGVQYASITVARAAPVPIVITDQRHKANHPDILLPLSNVTVATVHLPGNRHSATVISQPVILVTIGEA